MAVHGRLKQPKYQCHQCLAAQSYNARRNLRCGYVHAEDWRTPMTHWGYLAGSPLPNPETCPGYTTGLPAVQEIANAWGWFEKGQLGHLGDLPPAISTLVSLFNGEIVAAREWYQEHKDKQ